MHNKIIDFLNQKVSGAEPTLTEAEVGDSFITIIPAKIVEACTALRDSEEFEFNVLQVITGTDYPEHIELSYILASFINNTEVILKVKLAKDGDALPKVDTICSVWKAANWLEREVYDLLGVEFVGHPDPRRILLLDDFIGHPLRKDFKEADSFQGLTVSPTNKQNIPEQEFAAKQKAAKAAAAAAAKSE